MAFRISCRVLNAVLRPEGQLDVHVPHWMQALIFSAPAFMIASRNSLSILSICMVCFCFSLIFELAFDGVFGEFDVVRVDFVVFRVNKCMLEGKQI
jgi:hypothetical protein